MTKRNEKTSPRVAKIAAKVLAVRTKTPAKDLGIVAHDGSGVVIRWSDIRALAASCLTQAADKPKRKAVKRSRTK